MKLLPPILFHFLTHFQLNPKPYFFVDHSKLQDPLLLLPQQAPLRIDRISPPSSGGWRTLFLGVLSFPPSPSPSLSLPLSHLPLLIFFSFPRSLYLSSFCLCD
eukprot:TRINITY_DN5927_c2_g1_i1.p1 TRINITY_DN5927_c2_g1~~TRINITY_DN5927_c2_g1_i1.p1  ORF type:complete len:103 (+),score=17.74 TRINITY_DN5927_c2_g1_i1:390-698(+)